MGKFAHAAHLYDTPTQASVDHIECYPQGFGALYAGVLPALISVAPSGAVFYGTYDLLKVRTGRTCCQRYSLSRGSCVVPLQHGCGGGCQHVSVVARVQADYLHGCVLNAVPCGILQERHLALVAKRTGKPSRNLGTGLTLLYGGLAGVAAETAVYPLQIVQRYMQVHCKAGGHGVGGTPSRIPSLGAVCSVSDPFAMVSTCSRICTMA
jgi:hypothetical protein